MKIYISALLLAALVCGCGGEATVEIRNNTDRYVTGDVDGHTYSLPSSGQATRKVDVGGFMKISCSCVIPQSFPQL